MTIEKVAFVSRLRRLRTIILFPVGTDNGYSDWLTVIYAVCGLGCHRTDGGKSVIRLDEAVSTPAA